jgi:hypothetical protein
MPGRWGVESIGGRLVNVREVHTVCVLCRRTEIIRYEDGVFVRRTYSDETPVLHAE